LLLLVFAAIGGTIQNLHLRDALAKARQEEAEKTDKLWTSYLEQARAKRSSARIGQRFGCLAAIRAAAQIRVTPELRDEAIAALALPDMEVVREWEGPLTDTASMAFDSAFQQLVRLDRQGGLTVCRLTENGEDIVHRLSPHGEPPFAGPQSRRPVRRLWLWFCKACHRCAGFGGSMVQSPCLCWTSAPACTGAPFRFGLMDGGSPWVMPTARSAFMTFQWGAVATGSS
jgi:hypothetical protein